MYSQIHVCKNRQKVSVLNYGGKGPIRAFFSSSTSLGGASGDHFIHRSALATPTSRARINEVVNLPRLLRTDRSTKGPVVTSTDRPPAHKTGHFGNAVFTTFGVGHCARPPSLAIVRWPLSAPVNAWIRHCSLPSRHLDHWTSFFESNAGQRPTGAIGSDA